MICTHLFFQKPKYTASGPLGQDVEGDKLKVSVGLTRSLDSSDNREHVAGRAETHQHLMHLLHLFHIWW